MVEAQCIRSVALGHDKRKTHTRELSFKLCGGVAESDLSGRGVPFIKCPGDNFRQLDLVPSSQLAKRFCLATFALYVLKRVHFQN